MLVPTRSMRGFDREAVASHSQPHRRFTIVLCLAALLVWAIAAPATSALAGTPDHADSQGQPDHAGEDAPPQHDEDDRRSSSSSDADTISDEKTPADDETQAQERDDDAPRAERAEEVRDGQQGEEQRSERAQEVADGQQGEEQRDDRAQEPGGDEQDEAAEQDPNRGSIKVRSTGEQTWPPRHEPHQDACEFWIHFHGFDQDERDVRIYAWAPTGDQQLVYEGTVSLDDAQGNDDSGIYPTTPDSGLTLEDLDADAAWPDEYEAHEQQGWHLRVEVEGPKHKMFWLDCPAEEPEAAEPDPDEPEEPAEEPAIEPDEDEIEAPEEPAVEDVDLVVDQVAPIGIGGALPAEEVEVLGVVLEPDEQPVAADEVAPDAGVEVAGVVREAEADVLPVTGSSLAWLAAIGLFFSVVGARMAATGRPADAIR